MDASITEEPVKKSALNAKNSLLAGFVMMKKSI